VLLFDLRMVEQVRPEIDDPDPAWAELAGALPMPAPVIAGGASSPVPKERIDELLELLSDGRAVTVDAGHLLHAREPAEFLHHLLAFLDG